MQGIIPMLLAVIVYISSMLGLTPSAGRGIYPGSGAAPILPDVSYPGATEVMAFYAESSRSDSAAYESLRRAAGALTTVIPFSYQVRADGRITGSVNRKMLSLARASGLKVLALVHNAGSGRFDSQTVHAFLSNPLARRRFIEELYVLLIRGGLDGVNLDLENVPARDRWHLTSLVRDLAMRLRPRHFLVTASLPAKTGDDPGSSWSGAYDYKALAPYLDQAIIMAYDEHVAGGAPGPVASLGWVENVIRYAVGTMPRQKIVLGLPAYGYLWSGRGDRALDFDRIQTILNRQGLSPVWDYQAQVPHFQYYQAGARHRVWYENSRSAARKAALSKRYGLRGIAVWRLGYEDPSLWQALSAQMA